MEDKKHIRTVIAIALSLMLGACAYPYNKDRPYDPDFGKGESLFDQIPNWDGEALRKRACAKPESKRISWERDIQC